MILLVMCLFFFILYKSSTRGEGRPTRETPMTSESSQPDADLPVKFTNVYPDDPLTRAMFRGTRSKWMDSDHTVNQTTHPYEWQSQRENYVPHNKSVEHTPTRSKWKTMGSVEPEWIDPYANAWQQVKRTEHVPLQRREVQHARTRLSWIDNKSYQLIQPPASGFEDRIMSRFSNEIDIKGEQYPVFVECIFRVTNRSGPEYSTVVVILEQIDFGIDRICKKHPNGGKCDSSCSPFFIHKIDFHGSPEDAGKCDQAVLTVEPVETASSFSSQKSSQFKAGLVVNPLTNLFGTPFEIQVGSSMTREIRAWKLQASKHHAEVTWTWTLNRFEDGKKLKFILPNVGRRPKLVLDPRNMQLADKYTSSLAKATWEARGPPQTKFLIKVVVQVAAMNKYFFIHPTRKVETLELSLDSKTNLGRTRLAKDPTRNDLAYRFLGEIFRNIQPFER